MWRSKENFLSWTAIRALVSRLLLLRAKVLNAARNAQTARAAPESLRGRERDEGDFPRKAKADWLLTDRPIAAARRSRAFDGKSFVQSDILTSCDRECQLLTCLTSRSYNFSYLLRFRFRYSWWKSKQSGRSYWDLMTVSPSSYPAGIVRSFLRNLIRLLLETWVFVWGAEWEGEAKRGSFGVKWSESGEEEDIARLASHSPGSRRGHLECNGIWPASFNYQDFILLLKLCRLTCKRLKMLMWSSGCSCPIWHEAEAVRLLANRSSMQVRNVRWSGQFAAHYHLTSQISRQRKGERGARGYGERRKERTGGIARRCGGAQLGQKHPYSGQGRTGHDG